MIRTSEQWNTCFTFHSKQKVSVSQPVFTADKEGQRWEKKVRPPGQEMDAASLWMQYKH